MTNPDTTRLQNGSAPAGPDELFARLGDLGITVETVQHPPVYTVDQAKALRGPLVGCHTKNLFLRDKKGAMWLVVCREDRLVDLKALALMLGSGRLSLGSPDRLMKYLGVSPGAVTPFAVINDKGGHVQVGLDRAILNDEPWNFHPLTNDMTTSISADDMLRFLEAQNHPPQLLDFD